MWDGFNNRKFPRLNLKCEVRIASLNNSEAIVAKTENVGIGGVCLIQNKSLERFDRCHIKLELQEDLPQIECDGKICWIIPSHNLVNQEKTYDTGIEFVDLKDEDKKRLEEFIEANKDASFHDLG